MSTEKFVEILGEQISRRKFLTKVGVGTLGALAALLGTALPAEAVVWWKCCGLCLPNSGSCSGCACTWCWQCGPYTDGKCYLCCECHSTTSYCGSGCSNVYCSFGRQLSNCPQAPIGP